MPKQKTKRVDQSKARMVLWITLSGVLVVSGFLFVINYLHNPFEFGFASHRNHNLLLLTVDRLNRADQNPSLEAAALVFQNISSGSAEFFPFYTSLLASVPKQKPPLEETTMTLAELLKAQGYATAAYVSSENLEPALGLNQGFDVYKHAFDMSDTSEIVSWLAHHPKYFLWIDSDTGIPYHLVDENSVVVLASIHDALYIALPGGARKDVADSIRHVDILPTVIEWLGIPAYPSMKGRSLIPLLQGKETS